MKRRTRIHYSDAQKAQMWDRWQRGESLKSIGRLFDRSSSSIYPILSVTGGIRPPPRARSRLALTLIEREEISRGVAQGDSMRSSSRHINCPGNCMYDSLGIEVRKWPIIVVLRWQRILPCTSVIQKVRGSGVPMRIQTDYCAVLSQGH